MNDLYMEPRNAKPRHPIVVKTQLLAKSWRANFFEDTLRIGPNLARYARLEVPDFTLALAVRAQDQCVPLVRQYRYGARTNFWELPAGLVEDGEKPLDCVRREFSEEIGYELLRPKLVARAYSSPARSSQIGHIFVGRLGRPIEKHPDLTEELHVRFVPMKSALRLLRRNISSTHLLAYLLCMEKVGKL
jgi:ADP-ribose pyrophosphatase